MLSASVDRVLAGLACAEGPGSSVPASQQASRDPRVAVVPEGAATAEALLGALRSAHGPARLVSMSRRRLLS